MEKEFQENDNNLDKENRAKKRNWLIICIILILILMLPSTLAFLAIF